MAFADFNLIKLSFSFKFNKNATIPTIEFGYREHEKSKQEKKKITKKTLIKMLDDWYRLPSTQEFNVVVRNELTHDIDDTRSRAIKLFLKDIKEQRSETYGYEIKYIRAQNNSEKFIENQKLQRKPYEIQLKYRELYYIYNVIIMIIIGDFNKEKTSNNYRFKATFRDMNESRFYFDIDKNKLENYFKDTNHVNLYLLMESKAFTCHTTEFGTNIYCEDIVPAFYTMLGRKTDAFIAEHHEICNLNSYNTQREKN